MSAFKDAFREIFGFINEEPSIKYTLLSTLTVGSSIGLLTLLKKFYFNGPLINLSYLKPQPLNKYENKIVILTGGSIGGLGFETAKELLKLGMTVILPLRNSKEKKPEIDKELQSLKTLQNKKVNYEIMEMDLSNLDSVKTFVNNFKLKYQACHFLINNAGIAQGQHATTTQGIESHFGVNHLSHFLLTNLLLDILKASKARVINLSARTNEFIAKKKFTGNEFCSFSNVETVLGENKEIGVVDLYARSKLANILFTKKLNRVLLSHDYNNLFNDNTGDKNHEVSATTFSLHPGVIYTNIQGHFMNSFLKYLFIVGCWPFCKDMKHGIQTTLHCVLAPINELHSGGYYIDCKESKKYNEMVDSLELQEKLWNISLELCKPYLSN
ncbi:hypothetical protein ABK040_005656 [Willaertia magna]